MLIEYKIRFDDDGVTISQRIEPGGSEGNVRVTTGEDDSGVTAKELPVSFRMTAQAASDDSGQGGGVSDKSDVGGGVSDKSDVGGGEPDTAPIIIFGPIIVSGKARKKLRPDDGRLRTRYGADHHIRADHREREGPEEAQAGCPDHLTRNVSAAEESQDGATIRTRNAGEAGMVLGLGLRRRPRLFLGTGGRDPV